LITCNLVRLRRTGIAPYETLPALLYDCTMREQQNTNPARLKRACARTGIIPLSKSLTVFDKDAMVFEIQSCIGNSIYIGDGIH
jgi:hypothetical protein